MPSLTIENYVKAIYKVCTLQDGQSASTGRVAADLNVSPGSVTSMLKTLSEAGLVTYTPYEGARLTEAGTILALRVLRRHRLIELFLVKTLELTWDEIHEEAEHMEHAVSDFLVDRVDRFLGFPETDPHGDPIPRSDGSLPDRTSCSLAVWGMQRRFCLVRVLDQSAEFLRYLSDSGLSLGAEGEVLACRTEAGVVVVRVNGKETTLGRDVAEKILVEKSVSDRGNERNTL